MPEKAAPRVKRELSPKPLGEWPDGIDHAAPVTAPRDMVIDTYAQPPHEIGGSDAKRNIGFRDTQGCNVTLNIRYQAPPRHRDNRSSMSTAKQRRSIVDHCQAGPENEYGRIFVDGGG
jgi:hypothetical protein